MSVIDQTAHPLNASHSRVRLDAATVRANQASVWRYLRFLGCPRDAAEDLTQQAFLLLLEREIEDRGHAALNGWLRGVARNLWRERRRKLRDDLDSLEPADLERVWVEYARDDDGDGYQAALRTCLARLDERARRALDLRYRDDATRPEIGIALGVGDEGAKSVLRRAKHQLKQCIEQRLRDERS